MLVKNGYVISESWWKPYAPHEPHQLYSLSKSFTSTAVGMAVHEGLLSVNDPVVKFFPEEMASLGGRVDDKLERMTVRHLLTMSTGHTYEPWPKNAAEGGCVRAFLSGHIKNEPGSVFLYNSHATYMLSAILQRLTGQTLTRYLTPRLFEPLGIAVPYWEQCPNGIDFGGFGLNLTTEDIAKFGLLYLQKGMWQGRRLLSEEWIAEATSKQIENGGPQTDPHNEWGLGYGYQFWRCRHNAYRGDGAFGQFCVVVPEQNAVVAITSHTSVMAEELKMVWEYLLPALVGSSVKTDNAEISQPTDAYRRLLAEQENLRLPFKGSAAWPDKHVFIEKPFAAYVCTMESAMVMQAGSAPPIDIRRMAFAYSEARRALTLFIWNNPDRSPQVFIFEEGRECEGASTFPYGERKSPVQTALYWTDASRMSFFLRYYRTPFTVTMDCELSDDTLRATLCVTDLLTPLTIHFTGTAE